MMRKKTLLTFFLCFTSIGTVTNSFTRNIEYKISEWDLLIQSIIKVESDGNPNAVDKSGTCVGIMQIKKILVDDCNRILAKKKSNKRFTYNDRLDPIKSIEMFNLIQDYYNKNNDIHEAIRLWNGGCGWRKGKHNTQPYYNKVMKEFNERYKKMEAKNN